MADRRQYRQFCGLASALDVLGERWTLLVIRELLIGPARFNEIAANLPGVGPNILSERLQMLTGEGVVTTEEVAEDKRGRFYLLTPMGEELRQPVLDLSRWGMQLLNEERAQAEDSRAAWGFLAVQAMMDGGRVPGVTEEYEFHVDGESFHIRLDRGDVTASRGPADDPVLTVTTNAVTFIRIGAQLLTPLDAVLGGLVRAEGDVAALSRCTALLGLH